MTDDEAIRRLLDEVSAEVTDDAHLDVEGELLELLALVAGMFHVVQKTEGLDALTESWAAETARARQLAIDADVAPSKVDRIIQQAALLADTVIDIALLRRDDEDGLHPGEDSPDG